jgi:hypothetical protein
MEYSEEINNDMGITPRAIKQIFWFIKEVNYGLIKLKSFFVLYTK